MTLCPEDCGQLNVCENHFFNVPVWFYYVQRLIIKSVLFTSNGIKMVLKC